MKTKTGKFPSTRDACAVRLATERVTTKEKKWREDDDHESDLPRKPPSQTRIGPRAVA